jgi:hypothetical protein
MRGVLASDDVIRVVVQAFVKRPPHELRRIALALPD